MRSAPRALPALVLVLVAALALPAPVSAAPGSRPSDRRLQLDRQIESLREQVAEMSGEEAALLAQLDAADARLRDLSGAIAVLDARIVAAEADVAAAEAQLAGVEALHAAATRRVADVRGALRVARETLRARAVAAYADGPLLEAYAGAVLRSDLRELAARGGYLESVLRRQSSAVSRFRTLQEEAGAAMAVAAAARDQAASQRDAVAVVRDQLRQVRGEQDAARQSVVTETNRRAGVLAQVRSRRAEFESRIAELQAESDAIAAAIRARQASQPAAAATGATGALGWPLPGHPLTSRYGARVHPIFGNVRMHAGIDIGAPTGTPIRAAGAGEVIYAGSRGGYGNTVVVDHGNGLATLYAHQSRILVSDGERVARGGIVGLVGSTGFSTGPHLHFEVRVGGAPVDPLRYL